MVVDVGQCWSMGKVCGRGGAQQRGGSFASELCKDLYTSVCPARLATSE